jgi:threonine dehydrogenase-like Zn-dependent dehydrogenase
MLADVLAATGGLGVDVVFDAVGSQLTRSNAARAVRPGGELCLVGLHSDESALPFRDLIRREVSCITSFAYTPDDFAEALELLESDRIRFHGEIVHARLESGQSWYEQLVAGHTAGKVVLEPGPAGTDPVR